MRNYLTEDIEVYSVPPSAGAWGESNQPTLKAVVKGCLDNEGGREIFNKGKVEAVSTHTLYTLEAEIDTADMVKVKGDTYNVLYVSKYKAHNEIGLELRK